jgi:hypothetical protein
MPDAGSFYWVTVRGYPAAERAEYLGAGKWKLDRDHSVKSGTELAAIGAPAPAVVWHWWPFVSRGGRDPGVR